VDTFPQTISKCKKEAIIIDYITIFLMAILNIFGSKYSKTEIKPFLIPFLDRYIPLLFAEFVFRLLLVIFDVTGNQHLWMPC
jgi:hypothetical protein